MHEASLSETRCRSRRDRPTQGAKLQRAFVADRTGAVPASLNFKSRSNVNLGSLILCLRDIFGTDETYR